MCGLCNLRDKMSWVRPPQPSSTSYQSPNTCHPCRMSNSGQFGIQSQSCDSDTITVGFLCLGRSRDEGAPPVRSLDDCPRGNWGAVFFHNSPPAAYQPNAGLAIASQSHFPSRLFSSSIAALRFVS